MPVQKKGREGVYILFPLTLQYNFVPSQNWNSEFLAQSPDIPATLCCQVGGLGEGKGEEYHSVGPAVHSEPPKLELQLLSVSLF